MWIYGDWDWWLGVQIEANDHRWEVVKVWEQNIVGLGGGGREASNGIFKEHGGACWLTVQRKNLGCPPWGQLGPLGIWWWKRIQKAVFPLLFSELVHALLPGSQVLPADSRSSDLQDAPSQTCRRIHTPNPLDCLGRSRSSGLAEEKSLYILLSPFHYYYAVEKELKGKSSTRAKRTSKFTQRIPQIQV